ncbi:MAG: ATPase, T2SS/T4P/T4SS family [Clostridia bacterium]
MEKLLGNVIYAAISKLTSFNNILEIRIRINQPIMLKTKHNTHFMSIIADKNIINSIIAAATKNSMYAYENEITNGYINYKGGIRIGIVGNCNLIENNRIAFRDFYALCIRIPHQIFNIDKQIDFLINNFDSTLVISPPFGGKTTLIREMTRLLSNQFDTLVIDEREELCGQNLSLKVGVQCDVISNIPKNKVYGNIIRTMNPELVVCDELFGDEDINAIIRIINSGVKVLATYHANSLDQVPKVLSEQFEWYILLTSKPKVGSIKSIIRRGDE